MGIDGMVRELIVSLHSGSWFQVGSSPDLVVARRGGRQGCKLGAIVFNLVYAVALSHVRTSIQKQNCVLVIKGFVDSPFWGHSDVHVATECRPDENDETVIEVTFVDDEAIMLASKSPRRLELAILALLESLCTVSSSLGLELNFKPGKSEAFLVFRGKNAAKFTRKVFVEQHSSLPLPAVANADRLRIVQSYKHLGSVITPDGKPNLDVPNRTSSALTSYAPIAVSVFGSSCIAREVKINLCKSLILSRLLFNVHVWSQVSPWCLRKLNAVYMRVLRRIANQCRYDACSNKTDCEVRAMLDLPSIDCIVAKKRVAYLPTFLTGASRNLRALLSVRLDPPPGRNLPWVELIDSDLRVLQTSYGAKLTDLGDPNVSSDRWQLFIRSYPVEWKLLVEGPHFCSSILDCPASSKKVEIAEGAIATCLVLGSSDHDGGALRLVPIHACSLCAKSGICTTFSSQRALAMHLRKTHGERNLVKQYIHSSICPACGKKFSTRLRCVAHATEKRARGKRRTSCFELLSSGLFPRVDPVTFAELERADTTARREAARIGQTQPRSTGVTSLPDASDDIIHVVKRRRLFGKQTSDKLFVSMYLPRQIA